MGREEVVMVGFFFQNYTFELLNEKIAQHLKILKNRISIH
jgi:hypothetical protein